MMISTTAPWWLLQGVTRRIIRITLDPHRNLFPRPNGVTCFKANGTNIKRNVVALPVLISKPQTFVTFIQNHDQIANSAGGLRCHMLTSPGRYRAMTALMLLGPGTPMLFQGQEFAASSPFHYFADHEKGLAGKVRQGRDEFLQQFDSLAAPDMNTSPYRSRGPSSVQTIKTRHTPNGSATREFTRFIAT